MTFNSTVKFDSNAATKGQGGAINSTSGSITFNEKATFNSNTATTYGGAIYNSNILKLLGSTSEFSLNTAQLGGAIFNDGGTLSFSGTTLFDANTATSSSDSLNGGGALHQTRGVTSFSGDVTFKNNWSEKHGGAMGLTGGTITFVDVASSSTGSAVTFENNGFVVTENMDGTKTTTVKTDNGGAIYSKGKLTFNNTGLTSFKGNIAETGGAIYNQGEISFLDATAQQNISQKSVQFKGNSAVDNFSEDGSVLGGAVYNEGTIDFNNNVLFGAETSDLADQDGNKVYAEVDSADGRQTIVNALGGAVYNKGSLNFSGAETKCKNFYKTCDKSDICKGILLCIAKSLTQSINYCLNQYKTDSVLFVGGVASNTLLREYLKENINADSVFASTELSTDNAVGTAILGYLKKQSET
jgi:predicted outer membrane repeat protein